MTELGALERDFSRQGGSVVEKLEHWAKVDGDKPCLYYGEDRAMLSRQQFNALVNRAANGFSLLGVEKGDRISVLSQNAFVATIAMFGAWKIGAVYCPINTTYKGDLLAYVLSDTKPKALVLEDHRLCDLNDIAHTTEHNVKVVVYRAGEDAHDFGASAPGAAPSECFDAIYWNDLLQAPNENPDVEVTENDDANIIYTSGTTGRPKGVVQTHRWMHNYAFLSIKLGHQDSVIYSDLPLYHVAGAVLNVVSAIWCGSTIALWDRFSLNDFWRRMKECGASHATLMGVMIDWLLQAPSSREDRENTLSYVIMNPLSATHHEFAERFGIDFIATGYGSTELGTGFFGLIDELGDELGTPPHLRKGLSKKELLEKYREIDPRSIISGTEIISRGYMGVPSPLFEPGVLDEDGMEVLPGVSGQASFRPKLPGLLFREYFNKPEATAEAVRDGRYLPSDIISYDQSGNFYFKDRVQGFIRVRGENLSANSVELYLNSHPEIEKSAVIGVPADMGAEEDITAFIVKKKNSTLNEAEMRSWAEEALPKFMRPRFYRFIDKLPVTPTFKVERYKLKKVFEETGAG